jgi:hypothetical protein
MLCIGVPWVECKAEELYNTQKKCNIRLFHAYILKHQFLQIMWTKFEPKKKKTHNFKVQKQMRGKTQLNGEFT